MAKPARHTGYIRGAWATQAGGGNCCAARGHRLRGPPPCWAQARLTSTELQAADQHPTPSCSPASKSRPRLPRLKMMPSAAAMISWKLYIAALRSTCRPTSSGDCSCRVLARLTVELRLAPYIAPSHQPVMTHPTLLPHLNEHSSTSGHVRLGHVIWAEVEQGTAPLALASI